jgi:hypothetical protein
MATNLTGLTANDLWPVLGVKAPTLQNKLAAVIENSGPVNQEAADLIARFSSQPDATREEHIDILVGSLKTAGVWTKLDALYILAAHDAQAAQQNWVADAFNLTLANAPTFAVDQGYTGNGTTSYLETSFNPTTAVSPKFVQNDAHLGIWSLTDLPNGGATSSDIGTFGVSFIGRRNTVAGEAIARINLVSTTFDLTAAALAYPNHVMWSRSASNVWRAYAAGVDVNGGTDVSGALDNLSFRILGASGGTPRYGVNQIAVAHWGANLTATEAGDLYTALAVYLTAVGAI